MSTLTYKKDQKKNFKMLFFFETSDVNNNFNNYMLCSCEKSHSKNFKSEVILLVEK